jgi:hypothetical protein
MGTRNLTVVKNSQGTTKIAQYGQWDGYPSYSGIQVLEFLRDEYNQQLLEAKLDVVEFITDEELDTIYEPFKTMDFENKEFLNAYPGLHRDTGVDILKVVANAKGIIKTVDNSDFRNDELFCEGVYEVDFQSKKFISTYNEIIKEFFLENLPTNEHYLTAMGVELETV